jgi:hypothetical protein
LLIGNKDLDDNGRPFPFTKMDIGAYEFQGIPGGIALALHNESKTISVGSGSYIFNLPDVCRIIAKLEVAGSNPPGGNVTAKAFVEEGELWHDDLLLLRRHYDVVAANSPNNVTSRITLFYTQQDFDSYNFNPQFVFRLPLHSTDKQGIAQLRIYHYAGANFSGDISSYTGNRVVIDPDDNDIIWNAAFNRWEVAFDARGTGGFFVGTSNELYACPGSTVTLHTNAPDIFNSPQWQIDKGNGYENITDGVPFSGSNTKSLTISNTGTYMQGWKFQCMSGDYIFSPQVLYFSADWTGDLDNFWSVPQNWKCGIVPDENAAVVIRNNVVHFPTINTEAVIKSLTVEKGAIVQVANAVNLVLQNQQKQ